MKTLVLEVKDIVQNDDRGVTEESLKELAVKYGIGMDKVLGLFQAVSGMYDEYVNASYSKSKKRLWGSKEDIFLMRYMEYSSLLNDGSVRKKTKETVFKELAELFFNRTASSVQFRYYELRNRDYDIIDKTELNIFTNIGNFQVDIILQDDVTDIGNGKVEVDNKEDLLDMVISIVDNVDNLGIDVTDLFKSLLLMSEKAVGNGELEDIKLSMLDLDKNNKALVLELKDERENKYRLENELRKVKVEFDKIKREVRMFDSLSGKNKIKKLNNFKSNMKFIIEKYELETEV